TCTSGFPAKVLAAWSRTTCRSAISTVRIRFSPPMADLCRGATPARGTTRAAIDRVAEEQELSRALEADEPRHRHQRASLTTRPSLPPLTDIDEPRVLVLRHEQTHLGLEIRAPGLQFGNLLRGHDRPGGQLNVGKLGERNRADRAGHIDQRREIE